MLISDSNDPIPDSESRFDNLTKIADRAGFIGSNLFCDVREPK